MAKKRKIYVDPNCGGLPWTNSCNRVLGLSNSNDAEIESNKKQNNGMDLGDRVKSLTGKIGIKQCGACKGRKNF